MQEARPAENKALHEDSLGNMSNCCPSRPLLSAGLLKKFTGFGPQPPTLAQGESFLAIFKMWKKIPRSGIYVVASLGLAKLSSLFRTSCLIPTLG